MEVALDGGRLGDASARLKVENRGGVSCQSQLELSRLRQLRVMA